MINKGELTTEQIRLRELEADLERFKDLHKKLATRFGEQTKKDAKFDCGQVDSLSKVDFDIRELQQRATKAELENFQLKERVLQLEETEARQEKAINVIVDMLKDLSNHGKIIRDSNGIVDPRLMG